MLSKLRKALHESGDIGQGPAIAVIALVVAIAAAIFWWRDHASSNAKSPNYASPNIALPGGMTLPGAKPAPSGANEASR